MIYNNTYHRIIRMKPDNEKYVYIDFNREKIKKALNLDFFTMLKYQNTKIFLQKVTFQIGLKKSLWLKKSKILCRGLRLLDILMAEKLFERFTKKNCKKQIKKFRIQNVIKIKAINYMLNGKSSLVGQDIVIRTRRFPV